MTLLPPPPRSFPLPIFTSNSDHWRWTCPRVSHQPNANFIGEVVFGPDKIFAVDGNNGVIAVSAFPPLQPRLTINRSGANVVLSWSNSPPPFVLQSPPSLLPPAWANVAQPATVLGGQSFVTDITGPAGQFYRLIKP